MSETLVLVRWPAMGATAAHVCDPDLSEDERHALEIMDLDTGREETAVRRADPDALILRGTETGLRAGMSELRRIRKKGLIVDGSRIPFLKLTQRLSVGWQKNPLEADCRGCLLAVSGNGNRLAEELCSQGIPAVVIGRFTVNGGPLLIRTDGRILCPEQ